MSIGQTFKETLELSPNAHLGFTTFHDQKTCVRGGDARARASAHTHEAPIAPECHADAPRVRPFLSPPPAGLARAGNSQPGEEGSREVCVLIGLAGRQRARDQRAAPTRVAMTMAPMPVKSSSESSDTLARGAARYWIARAPPRCRRNAYDAPSSASSRPRASPPSRWARGRAPRAIDHRRRTASAGAGRQGPAAAARLNLTLHPLRVFLFGVVGWWWCGAEAAESRSSPCNCLSH